MATRVLSPPRKHRSSGKDRKDSRKQKKDSRKDKTRHSKKPSGLKVRTVSELAALVSSGAVKVPQGLEHYMSDRQQLLDQVFTILGPEDVSGMMPDPLKSLKIKRVKSLCLVQLQSMSEQELLSIIQPTSTSSETGPNQTNSSSSQPLETEEVSGTPLPENNETNIALSDISEDESTQTKDNTPDIYNSSPSAAIPNTTESITGQINNDVLERKSTEIGQFLEMDLRQRALESALKKATHTNDTTEPSHENINTPAWKNDPSSTVSMEQESLSEENEGQSEGTAIDYVKAAGELVEQKLREKLLLSLAAKRQ